VPGSPSVDPLKYQRPEESPGSTSTSDELLTVKLRYKAPDEDKSKLIEIPLTADDIPDFDAASEDFRFASAVAAFGMKLRSSPDAGEISWPEIQDIVRGALGQDPGSYRAEFLTLIEKAKALAAARSDAASAPGTYKVAEGDNLYKIAKRFGVSSRALLQLNGIEDPAELQIGQVLKVPAQAN
jgi:LysM repeat protein